MTTINTASLLSSPSKAVQYWQALNPGFIIHIHNDSQCRAELLRDYGESLVQVYDSIPLWARPIRSDLWRAAYLYKHGGVYADDDTEPMQPLERIVWPNDSLLTSLSVKRGSLNPHFIVVRRRHPLMRETLREMLWNMNRSNMAAAKYRLYPRNALGLYWNWSICTAMFNVLWRHGWVPDKFLPLDDWRSKTNASTGSGHRADSIAATGAEQDGVRFLMESKVVVEGQHRKVTVNDKEPCVKDRNGGYHRVPGDSRASVSAERLLMFNKLPIQVKYSERNGSQPPRRLWKAYFFSNTSRIIRERLCPELCL